MDILATVRRPDRPQPTAGAAPSRFTKATRSSWTCRCWRTRRSTSSIGVAHRGSPAASCSA